MGKVTDEYRGEGRYLYPSFLPEKVYIKDAKESLILQ